MNNHLHLIFLVSILMVCLLFANSAAEHDPGASSSGNYITAYQTHDSQIYHIWCKRNVGGSIDSFRVSPDIDPFESRWGYSEPLMMGEGSALYCAMIVHKQVKGDSAYIMVRKSTDFGESWSTLAIIDKDEAIARHLAAEYKNGVIRMVWEDCRSGYWRIHHGQVNDY